jgi:proline dehydrogenase
MGFSDAAERLFAGRYIAGPTIDDAVERCRALNRRNVRCLLNYLGEELRDERDVLRSVEVYKLLIDRIVKEGLRADISLKPSEVGLLVGEADEMRHYSELVDYAARKGVFVWMDMEEREHVGASIRLYLSKVKKGNTGICIQSYLRRSGRDLALLAGHHAIVRLVKGAYSEPEQYAFQSREETTKNYYGLMDVLFRRFRRFTIGTHDTGIIGKALEMNRHYKRDVTYAMLMGIKGNYLGRLAKRQGCAVYVPFGRSWVKFTYRRLKELSNLRLIVSSLFD